MKYLLVKKDGSKIPITAQAQRVVIPRVEFYNTLVKGGRKVDEIVFSVPIDDVTTVQVVDESVDSAKKEDNPTP